MDIEDKAIHNMINNEIEYFKIPIKVMNFKNAYITLNDIHVDEFKSFMDKYFDDGYCEEAEEEGYLVEEIYDFEMSAKLKELCGEASK